MKSIRTVTAWMMLLTSGTFAFNLEILNTKGSGLFGQSSRVNKRYYKRSGVTRSQSLAPLLARHTTVEIDLEDEVTTFADPESLVTSTRDRMKRSLDLFRRDLSQVQVGRASPSMLHHIHVKAYGLPTPISHLATISAVGTQLLTVEPYDASLSRSIEKAICRSDLELNAVRDGTGVISMIIPPLNEEVRVKMAKRCRSLGEESKVALRNVRRKSMDELKNMSGLGEDANRQYQKTLQKMTDNNINEVENLVNKKEKDVMTL